MSSQKGNTSRSRAQKHQNVTAFKNNKYGATAQVKKANAKVHDGLCQHCKGVLEWKVKYSKYKPLTQPKKCVKCSQKTVKDAYHIVCKPCSLQLEICCKCGKKEEIVIPVNSTLETTDQEDDQKTRRCRQGRKDGDDLNSDEDFDDVDSLEDDSDEDLDYNSESDVTKNKSCVLPDVKQVKIRD
ncbi:hypothetical protein OJAV_G00091120 [Oryzias javanicus]|uniref:Uncharacterized protein n=1 Tax=Oryzias javanicus TaxID=123683 RepID=A0A3S2Q2X0_ORYJA|nr:hypothetical protein OJAV_G00091120 [Oryzias javanicus]